MNIPVSVVIPAYNEERYIGRVLECLMKQTIQGFEIVVVDNNSTDKTAEIARSYGARVVKEKIQGMIPARERGFQEAKGEIILRTDADTIVPPHWVETFYTAFQTHPDIVAASGNLRLPVPFGSFIIAGYNILCRISLGHYQLNGPNMAIKKSVWTTINVCKNDTDVHEDIDLAIHMGRKGRILFLSDLYVTYSMRRFQRSFFPTLFEYSWRQIKTIYRHSKHKSP
ncbi:MAG: glycosyltransferase family 2 protein [Patescibacteria group bacterium]|nr:glycosyltransferase family 2 protein [Patescibacteria group bacterium]